MDFLDLLVGPLVNDTLGPELSHILDTISAFVFSPTFKLMFLELGEFKLHSKSFEQGPSEDLLWVPPSSYLAIVLFQNLVPTTPKA